MSVTLTGTPVLRTQRLILRAPGPRDVGAFTDFVTSDRARFVGGPLTEPGRAWRTWGTMIGHWVMRGFGMFTIVRSDDDAPIGMAGPWFPDAWPEREIGWTIWSADAEGRGYAAEAAAAARDFAFSHLGWTTAVSYIDAQNARSIALAQRLGATLDKDAEVPPPKDDGVAVQVWRHTATTCRSAAPATAEECA